MRAREGRWRDVEPGGYVKDKNGVTWKVLLWNHVRAVIQNREGRKAEVRPNPYDAVTIMEVTMEDAVSVVERMLDGEVIREETTQ